MSDEAKVMIVFGALVLVLNLAVLAFIWVRLRRVTDRMLARAVLVRLLSTTLVISGLIVCFAFRSSLSIVVGAALVAVGIVLRFGSSITLAVIRRRRR